METYFYDFCTKFAFPILRKVHSYKYYAQIPRQGASVVVVDPHTSNVDPFIVGAAFSGRVYSWVKVEFLDTELCQKDLEKVLPQFLAKFIARGVVWMMKGAGTMPVARRKLMRKGGIKKQDAQEINAQTYQRSLLLLRQGRMVGIFPAGTRKRNAKWSDSFLTLAQEANVPLRLVRLQKKKNFWTFARYDAVVSKKIDAQQLSVSDVQKMMRDL